MRKPDTTDFDRLVRRMLDNSPMRDSYLLSLWGNYFSGPTAAELEQSHGLTRDDFNVIFTLNAAGPMTAADICLANGRPKNSVSRAVIKMTGAGHIARAVDAHDRRKVDLSLTDQGHALCEELMAIYLRRQEEMMANLTRPERDLLNVLLQKSMVSPGRWVRKF